MSWSILYWDSEPAADSCLPVPAILSVMPMMQESEGQEGNEETARDLPSLSQHDLDALGRSLQADLVRLRDVRRQLVERSQTVAAERARRRDIRLEETYAERRRRAVASGDAPPEPPPSVDRAASRTTASRRLAVTAMPASRTIVGRTSDMTVEQSSEPSSPRGTGVSDHAIIRYMERALGIDMDRIRAQIRSPLVESAMQAGVSRVRTAEGVFVLRDHTVVSFLPSASLRPRKVSRGRPAAGWSDRDVPQDEDD